MTRPTGRGSRRRVILGSCWLLLLAALLGTTAWLVNGCLVPYVTASDVDYVLLLPRFASLAASCAAAFVALLLVHVVSVRWSFHPDTWRDALEWRPVAYLSPLVLLFIPLASVAMLATPLSVVAGPWLYVSFDLGWWFAVSIAAFIVVTCWRSAGLAPVVRLVGRFEAARTSSAARRWLGVVLAALLAVSSLVFAPPLRFQSVLVGDEPKYLRYLENWYRGKGLDVADLGPIGDLPADFRPDLTGNLQRLGSAVEAVASDLVSDSRRLVGLSGPTRSGTAKSGGGWFVEGRHGGIYQVHNPGFSLLLLPGYLIDRHFVSRSHNWHPQFPTDLYATNLTVLGLYTLWGWALFRLLWQYTGKVAVSWLIAGIVLLSLPATGFAYQYYPEAAAGLISALLFRYAVLSLDSRPWPALAYGVLAGFLAWLHLRFLPLGIGAAVSVAFSRRSERGVLAWFLCGLLFPLLALGLYCYHVTGNPMPWALYALMPDEPLFSAVRVSRDLPALWLDRTWGLIPHSPVFLFSLPGLWLAWRRRRSVAIAVAGALLLIAIPAAGHGYTGAFTTPTRLIAAVVPLLALPLADAALEWRTSRWFVGTITLLAAVSIQNGITYNLHLIKSRESLQASTIGGWLFPLLLPTVDRPHRFGDPFVLVWIAITAGLLVSPLVVRSMSSRLRPGNRLRSPATVAFVVVAMFAATSSLVAAISGARFDPAFALEPGDARDRLVHFELTAHPGLRWSSRNGRIDLRSYFPDPDGTATRVEIEPDAPRARQVVTLGTRIRRPGNRPGWGTATIDFGDGSPPERVPVEGSARIGHTYERPGTYLVTVSFDLWGLPYQVLKQSVRIDGD